MTTDSQPRYPHSIVSHRGDLGAIFQCVNCRMTSPQRFDGECLVQEIYHMIRKGYTDREIAFDLDLDDDEVARWRTKLE